MVSDHSSIEQLLSGTDLQVFRDHRHAAAAIHLVLVRGRERCYLVVRRDRRKGLAVFASLLHISNPGLLRGHLPTLGRHLLLHHGLLCSLVEVRLRIPFAGTTPKHAARAEMLASTMLQLRYLDRKYGSRFTMGLA